MTDTSNKPKADVIKNALAMYLQSTMMLVEMRISPEEHAVRSVAIMEGILDIAMQEIAARTGNPKAISF